ncbi:diguanylate cyclase domain-containing protein [Sulfurimonas sp.]|uniref:diguanylate cyclase domain-containing protein n=1 Tax=Sulfurimonas sp. TaxID=2022749 RepID=UPI003561D67A
MRKKRVLILEINDKNFNSLESILKQEGYESIQYRFDVEDFDFNAEDLDVALVNTNIDYINIEQVFTRINLNNVIKVPIVFLDNSQEHDKQVLQKCYENGGSDFIKRPFGSKEIISRLNYHCEQIYKLREYKLRVDKLAHLATVDQMSKLTSKMHMQGILKHQVSNFNRYKSPTSILYIGLESVDRAVSTFGFEYGEKMIQLFSKQLKNLLRDSDAVSRWYGSNFMILLSGTNVKQAEIVAKKLNTSLSTLEIMNDTKPVVAFGITEFTEDDSVEEIEQRAVYALKEAKKKDYGKIFVC